MSTVPLIPARYIGDEPKLLDRAVNGRLRDGDGNLRQSDILRPGEILLLPATEVLGQSLLYDLRRINPPLFLGAGKVVLPEHQACSPQELSDLGYEFHLGRSDFEPIVDSVPASTDPAPDPAPARVRGKSAPVDAAPAAAQE